VESFQPERGLAFSTFAAPRIRGAILDDLRRRDTASRSLRRKQRALAHARETVSRARDRAPRDAEMAGELGIDLERLWRWQMETERTRQVSLDQPLDAEEGPRRSLEDALPGTSGAEVEDVLEREQLGELLKDAILELREQERVVLSLYYFEEMKLREIAEVLGVTESRVSQVRSKALKELRGRLAHLTEAA
jgi:RNA polymerase sigma factor for flagellar operon FliA